MLREIGAPRLDEQRRLRRWFQDDYFDLYVWLNDAGHPIAFQLCYDRHRVEGAISWSHRSGYAHARVDDARMTPGMPSTPLLLTGSVAPYFRLYPRFLEAVHDWPERELRAFMLQHLRAYRRHLFGSRRTIRRPRRSEPR